MDNATCLDEIKKYTTFFIEIINFDMGNVVKEKKDEKVLWIKNIALSTCALKIDEMLFKLSYSMKNVDLKKIYNGLPDKVKDVIDFTCAKEEKTNNALDFYKKIITERIMLYFAVKDTSFKDPCIDNIKPSFLYVLQRNIKTQLQSFNDKATSDDIESFYDLLPKEKLKKEFDPYSTLSDGSLKSKKRVLFEEIKNYSLIYVGLNKSDVEKLGLNETKKAVLEMTIEKIRGLFYEMCDYVSVDNMKKIYSSLPDMVKDKLDFREENSNGRK